MMKYIGMTLACCMSLGVQMNVQAKSLGQEMQVLSSQYNQFQSTDDAKSALQALAILHTTSLDAQKNLPHHLHGLKTDDPQIQAYYATYQPLIDTIEQAKALVEAGQLEHAQHVMEQVDAIKKQAHQRFK